jgi:hypothetical protein
MAGPNKTSAMVPLMIVGACLFGLGTYQAMKPKQVEVNKGYEAPANPRTMQAPDGPAMTKDAAQLAAEADETTLPPAATVAVAPKAPPAPTILDQDWFKALKIGDTLDFRGTVLPVLKKAQIDGAINCSPALTPKSEAELALVEKVTCLAGDGTQIKAEFGNDYTDDNGAIKRNDGDLVATTPDNKVVKIEKSGNEFNVTTEEGR